MAGERIRGKKAFINDPRNFLFRHYVEVVKIVLPKVFLLENVKGILSKDNGAIFKEIVDTFGNSGNFDGNKYYLHFKVCKAVEYGIPQKRERVVVIGVLNNDFNIDEMFSLAKNDILKSEPHFFNPTTLKDAISDIPAPTIDGNVKLLDCMTDYQASLRNTSGFVTNHVASKHNDLAIGRMQNSQVENA